MRVICIDDSYRPSDIKISNWIVKEQIYTVVNTFNSNGKLAYILEEVAPDLPYYGYYADRFKSIQTDESILREEILEKELVLN